MQRILSFALGNIWRWNTSKNRGFLIDKIKNLNISGVELTFPQKEELYSFRLSFENREWLKTLDYVTIHAPFNLFKDSENEAEVVSQINCISKIYNNINAKNVVIHPEDELLNSDVLKQSEFSVSIENLPRKTGVSILDLQKILKKYPLMRLCLDVSHAYSWSKYETRKLIKAFKGRISQIHFSGNYRKRDHQSLRKVSRDFLFAIQPIKELWVPIVVEEDMETKGLEYVRKELEYIKINLENGFNFIPIYKSK